MYNFDLPIILYSYYISCVLTNYGHARSQGGRQPAAGKAPLVVYCGKLCVQFPCPLS